MTQPMPSGPARFDLEDADQAIAACGGGAREALKALIVAAVVFLLAVLIWATASNRQGQQ